MIYIVNMDKRDRKGATLYHLKINNELIAEFYHQRSDGLAVCLQRASEAAHMAHGAKIERLLKLVAELEGKKDD